MLDHHEQLVLIGAEVVEDGHARVAEPCRHAGFPVEPPHRVPVTVLAGTDELNDDLPVEPLVDALPEVPMPLEAIGAVSA
jgi:hypothetical protein